MNDIDEQLLRQRMENVIRNMLQSSRGGNTTNEAWDYSAVCADDPDRKIISGPNGVLFCWSPKHHCVMNLEACAQRISYQEARHDRSK